jgi:hypothetical protein
MRTGPLIVSKIALQSTTQRPLIPHDNVVQALASDGAHESFQKRILPRGSRRGEDFRYPHISGHVGKVSSIDGISIAPHVSWRLLPGKRFPHLLHRPLLRGVFRHPEVQYPASLMGKNDEDEQDPEGRRRHGEKINGRGLCKVIHQKGPPSLGSRFARPRQIFGHRGLRHLNSQLEQFSVNPRCTPTGGGLVHAPNEITKVCRYFRPSRKASRFPRPMPGKSSAVPAQDRVGRHHVKTSPAIGPESAQHNPQQPVATVEAQATRRVVSKNRKLVTKRQDLRLQSGTGSKSGDYQSEKSDEKRAHRGNRHDLTNDRNLCVFRWDGVFGNHTPSEGLGEQVEDLLLGLQFRQALCPHKKLGEEQISYMG